MRARPLASTWLGLTLFLSWWTTALVAESLVRQPSFSMTPEAYRLTREALDAYLAPIKAISSDRTQPFFKRGWSEPYYLLHPAGAKVRGTVILFHGFTSRPHQMAVMAQYLFEQGFNVWNASLPNHWLQPNPRQFTAIDPEHQWPQEVLVDRYRKPLLRIYHDDVRRSQFLEKFPALINNEKPSREDLLKKVALAQAILDAELKGDAPQLLELYAATENPFDAKYEDYFIPGHRIYEKEALAHLERLKALPGPTYAIGLSVGGTVALNLAAARPDKIAGVVAYAPLLETKGEDNRRRIKIVGPSNEVNASNRGADFNVSSYQAAEILGKKTRLLYASKRFPNVPIFLVLTDSPWESAAEIDASKAFFRQLANPKNSVEHTYGEAHRIPHAMIDPKEATTGGLPAANGQTVVNEYWISLYRETLRFITDGAVNKVVLEDPNNKVGDEKLPWPEDRRTEGWTPNN